MRASQLLTLLAGGTVDPANILVNTYGAAEVWKFTDITSGTTVKAHVSSARNGTLTGLTLQNTVTPLADDTKKAPYWDGTNDYADIHTANLASLFDGTTGAVMVWFTIGSAGVWTDATERYIYRFEQDGSNYLRFRRTTTNNQLRWDWAGNGSPENYAHTTSATDGHMYTITWDVGSGMEYYVDGGSVSSDTGEQAWTGSPATALVGASSSVPAAVMDGSIYYLAIWAGSRPDATAVGNIYTELTT